MRALNVLLSLLVSLAIALLVFEGGLRLIGMGPKETLHRFDPVTGWSKKPDYHLVRRGKQFTATFDTNALGLRDDPMTSTAKQKGVFRVVMLGDSFTLGYTVERADLFVDILEQHWRDEGRPVEILNVGTEAWSTDQEVAWLLAHGEDYEPDLVVLLPYDNDVFYCGELEYNGLAKPRFAPDGGFDTTSLADRTGDWNRTTAIGRLVAGRPKPPTFVTPAGHSKVADFAPLYTEPPAVLGNAPERAKGALRALQSACSELRAALVVVPIPSNASVDAAFAERFGNDVLGARPDQWDPDRVLEFYLDACAELGIEALDARAALKSAHAAEPCYLDFFGPDREWHFNPAGNRAFASFLAGALASRVPPKDHEASPALLAGAAAPLEAPRVPTFLLLYGVLWLCLTTLYFGHYRDEPLWLPPLKVGIILAVVFSIFMGVDAGVTALAAWSPLTARVVLGIAVLGILGFVAYKLGDRLATIAELLKAFALRGHWYLMPMVVVLLTIGSLLVVAASSPFVAPFIYTLF